MMGFDEEPRDAHEECGHEIDRLEAQLGEADVEAATLRQDLADQINNCDTYEVQLAERGKEIEGLKRRALPSDKYQVMGPPRDATPEAQLQWLTENRNLQSCALQRWGEWYWD